MRQFAKDGALIEEHLTELLESEREDIRLKVLEFVCGYGWGKPMQVEKHISDTQPIFMRLVGDPDEPSEPSAHE